MLLCFVILESKLNKGSICSSLVSRVICKSPEWFMVPFLNFIHWVKHHCKEFDRPLSDFASLALFRLDEICRFLADFGGILTTSKTAVNNWVQYVGERARN